MLLIRLITRCYSAIINWVDFSLLKSLIPFLDSSFLMFQLQYIIKSFFSDPIYLDFCRCLIPRWTFLCLSWGNLSYDFIEKILYAFTAAFFSFYAHLKLRSSSGLPEFCHFMLMLLLKILHNFSRWRSSSTFPFSIHPVPLLSLPFLACGFLRDPFCWCGFRRSFYLAYWTFHIHLQFSLTVVPQYPALFSYCRWIALFPFFLSHTLFCSGLWRITFFFTVFLFCAGIAILELVRWLSFSFHISVWKIPVLLLLSVASFKVLSGGSQS